MKSVTGIRKRNIDEVWSRVYGINTWYYQKEKKPGKFLKKLTTQWEKTKRKVMDVQVKAISHPWKESSTLLKQRHIWSLSRYRKQINSYQINRKQAEVLEIENWERIYLLEDVKICGLYRQLKINKGKNGFVTNLDGAS